MLLKDSVVVAFDTKSSETFNNIKATAVNTDSIAAGQYLRPSQFNNRVHKTISINNVNLTASNTLFYTVPLGKTLYVSTLVLTALNSSTSSIGNILISSTETTLPFLLNSQSTIIGSSPESAYINLSLTEPAIFSGQINIAAPQGLITVSCLMIGYEE